MLTPRCNLSCRHCYASRFLGGKELDTEEALRIVQSAAQAGVKHIGLSGGEIFLRKDIFALLQAIRDKGISLSIVSNGLLLNPQTISKLAPLHPHLIISLDGPTKETHEQIRGKGTWEQVMATLDNLRHASVPFSLIMSLNRENIGQVREFILLAKRLSAQIVYLIPVFASGRASRELAPSSGQIFRAIALVDKVAEALSFPVSFWCVPFVRLIARSRYVYSSGCRDSRTMDIDPGGRVLLCDVLDIELGNVRGREISELWEEQEAHPLVKALGEPLLREPCLSCPLKRRCLGGCFARAHIEGDIHSPDPLCPKVAGYI